MALGNAQENDIPIWLVKSGERILGPYTREDVKQRLLEREIVVIDEIITPNKRWRYIRDEPTFALVVEEIRKAHLSSRDDTELGTISKTLDDMDTAYTPTPIRPDPSRGKFVEPNAKIQDAEIVSERTSVVHPSKPQPNQTVRSYGSTSDQRVHDEAARGSRAIWITAVVFLAVAAFLFYRFQSPSKSGSGRTSELLAQAQEARNLGDYRAAITIYDQLRNSRRADDATLVDLAVLKLKVGDESEPPARILDTVSAQDLTGEAAARFYTAKGLVALGENGRVDGAKQNFDIALKADRAFAPASFNRAMAQYLDPKFPFSDKERADKLANEFLRLGDSSRLDPSGKHAAKIMVALVRLKNREASSAKQARDHLERVQRNQVQYWQEASFLRAYGRYLSGQPSQAARDLRITLGADPFVTDEHINEPFLYVELLSWRNLLPLCEEMYNGSSTSSVKRDHTLEVMYYFCRFKAGIEPEQAREELKGIEAKSISDPLVKSVSAFMVMGIAPDQAKAKVSGAEAGVSWDLGRLLRGRLCGRQDGECIYNSFKENLMVPTSLYLKIGAARYLAKQNDSTKKALATDAVEETRKISPNYFPLLEYDAEVGR